MAASKRLVLVWTSLLVLTLLTGMVTRSVQGSVGPVVLGILALASLAKARFILSHYLDLRQAPDWNKAFLAVLFVLMTAVYGLLLIPDLK